MRVRELEARLIALGWVREADKGGSIVRWHHPRVVQVLTYHRPHGTDARELRKDVVRDILKRLEHMQLVAVPSEQTVIDGAVTQAEEGSEVQ